MPSNKLAGFRYRIINDCFRNPGKPNWTIDELMTYVADKILDNFTPKRSDLSYYSISKRTIQSDIALMRAEPPKGYAAPIICENGEYFYSDKNFNILQINLSERDKLALREATILLRQFKGLPHFEALEQTLLYIENRSAGEADHSLIAFEENTYSGMDWIKPIYSALKLRKPIRIDYEAFDASEINKRILHPYLLKEFRNRWYIFGWDEHFNCISSAALDRIKEVKILELMPFRTAGDDFNAETFFKDIIGVTVMKEVPVERIILKVAAETAPYLITKPLHQSQVILKTSDEFTFFEYRAKINYELIAELRRLGAAVEVLSPYILRETLRQEFQDLAAIYNDANKNS